MIKEVKSKVSMKKFLNKKIKFGSMRSGFSRGLLEVSSKNKNVVALTADLKDSLKLTEFALKYPSRFFEFGISEQNMMSAAAGMTITGKVPFVCSYAAFNPGRNWDQLRVSVCYQNSNVKILGGHAGLMTGKDGATHQMLEDIAITRVIPRLCVVVPCDEEETRKATIAVARMMGPVYMRISREVVACVTKSTDVFEIGQANVLKNGSDLTIVACGICVKFALDAAKKLKEEDGLKCAVINLHTIKPLDEKTLLKFARKTGRIITVEEHQIAGGMGSAICEFLAGKCPVFVERVGVENSFGESGDGFELCEKYGVSTSEILLRAKKIMKKKIGTFKIN